MGNMNLTKYLSTGGVASRRKCADMIKAGHVTVNGETISQPGTRIGPDDRVEVDGHFVVHEKRVYVMLNKPPGYWCTADDPHADKLAVELIDLPGIRLFSAGRLDRDSEGLIIFTNDGEYANKLSHPSYGILKQYQVETFSEIIPEKLAEIRVGIVDNGEKLSPYRIDHLGAGRYLFTLNEGKKREIRRLVTAAGQRVKLLRRTVVGSLELADLESGQWRKMTESEIAATLKNP
jgi:pseudouridine synthase